MLDHVATALSKPRWRMVIIAVALLMAVHLLFVDDTLRTAYNTHIEPAAPAPAPAAPPPVEAAHVEPTPVAPTPAASTPAASSAPAPAASTAAFVPSAPPAAFDDGDKDEYLAICVAVKDQAADLGEWLTHHYQHLGIRRFYLMDDGSTPALATLNYSAFVDPKALTHRYYHPATRVPYMQLAVYSDCLALFGRRHKWIAFIDADEFLEFRPDANASSLQALLRTHDADDSVGALAVNWRLHTSAGLLTRPASAREAFTRCVVDEPRNDNPPADGGKNNEHIKVIVKPARAVGPQGPHKFALVSGARTVGENGDDVARGAWRVPATRKRVSLHHYVTKSKAEYAAKIERSNGMGDAKGWAFWDKMEAAQTVECKEMVEFKP